MKLKLLDLIKNSFNIVESDSKQTINQNRYKQLFIHISDGLHNYQDSTFFANNPIDKNIYAKDLRDFLSYLRFIQLNDDLCSEEK